MRLNSGQIATFVVSLAVSGCGSESPTLAAWEGTLEVRDGVTYVENTNTPLWGPPNSGFLNLVLEQTFGSDTEDDAILGRPSGVAVGADGRVYVVDGADDRIVAFESDGEFAWTAGKNGEGPGEFNDADRIVVSGPGELTISEFQGRLQRWTTSGEYIDRFDLPVQFAYMSGLLNQKPVMATGIRGTEGATVSVLGALPDPEIDYEFDVVMHREEGERPATIVAGPGIARGQFVFGSTRGYRLTFHGQAGEQRRVVTRPVDHLPGVVRTPDSWTVWGWASHPHSVGAEHWLVTTHGVRLDQEAANSAFLAMRRGDPVSLTWRSTLELLDGEGRLLALECVDTEVNGRANAWFGTVAHYDPDGFLYTTTDDPFPQVRRYRLEINAPAGFDSPAPD